MCPSTEPLVRHRPRLVDSVADELRDWIITGRLSAGTQLLQIELAEQLQVSRTPLREAFRILERDGLVRTSNNNRTVEVVSITREALIDMFLVRERLEALAARQAASRGMTEAERKEGHRLLSELESSAKSPFAPEKRIRAHADFHELILRTAHNTALEGLGVVIRTSSAAMYLPLGDEPQNITVERGGRHASFDDVMAEADAQHREILRLIEEGDADGAENAAAAHARRTATMLENYEDWRDAMPAAGA